MVERDHRNCKMHVWWALFLGNEVRSWPQFRGYQLRQLQENSIICNVYRWGNTIHPEVGTTVSKLQSFESLHWPNESCSHWATFYTIGNDNARVVARVMRQSLNLNNHQELAITLRITAILRLTFGRRTRTFPFLQTTISLFSPFK